MHPRLAQDRHRSFTAVSTSGGRSAWVSAPAPPEHPASRCRAARTRAYEIWAEVTGVACTGCASVCHIPATPMTRRLNGALGRGLQAIIGVVWRSSGRNCPHMSRG